MKYQIFILLFTTVALNCKASPVKDDYEVRKVQTIEDKNVWYNEARNRLNREVEKMKILNRAKNIILFVGDGMGITTITASRIYKGQLNGNFGEESYHTYELFSNVGLIKTYSVDTQVTDSAASATAMLCGVKNNQNTIGVDATATHDQCDPEVMENAKVESLVTWAQKNGMRTGVVTTTRITHATPAAAYAQTTNRDWECDSEIPEQYKSCMKDIASQLVENSPGKDLNVIFGGGLHQFGFGSSLTDTSCKRSDNRNLTSEWEEKRVAEGVSFKFVKSKSQMDSLDKEEKVLGLFDYGHLPYDLERDTTPDGQPSLAEMTAKAINLLQNANTGFFLLVEGGRIDHGHHENFAKIALTEAVRFEEAVETAFNMTSSDETLIIVTADHSHSITINGYPKRGNDILGFAQQTKEPPTEYAYETITYANGPGFSKHRKAGAIDVGEYLWNDPSKMDDRDENRYRHFAPIHESSETHAGEDVAIYANGPFSHLFNGVFEQSYIAHAISCAGKFGPSADYCNLALSLRPSPLALCALIIIKLFFV